MSANINIAELPSLPLAERSRLPNEPGIYFVLASTGEIIYIGQTESLLKRWLAHSRFCQLEADNRIAWVINHDKASRRRTEAFLINELQPRLNGTSRVFRGGGVVVYLVVPAVLHEWLQTETAVGGFRNVQEKILDVLRTAQRETKVREQEEAVA